MVIYDVNLSLSGNSRACFHSKSIGSQYDWNRKDSLTPHEGIRIASGNGKKSPFFTFNHFSGRLLAVGSSKSFNEPSYNNAESWQFNDTIIEITGTGQNLTTGGWK